MALPSIDRSLSRGVYLICFTQTNDQEPQVLDEDLIESFTDQPPQVPDGYLIEPVQACKFEVEILIDVGELLVCLILPPHL